MVPPVFIPLKKLPLSASAKVDRCRLCELASSLSTEEWEGYQTRHVTKRSPQTSSEKLLQEVVSKVLQLPCNGVGIDDDFFPTLRGTLLLHYTLLSERRHRGLLSVLATFSRRRSLLIPQ
jgi:hypothetical protein